MQIREFPIIIITPNLPHCNVICCADGLDIEQLDVLTLTKNVKILPLSNGLTVEVLNLNACGQFL